MKYIYITICTIFIMNISFSQVNKAIITYKVKYVIPKTEQNKDFFRKNKLLFNEIENLEIQLLFNENKSIFKTTENLELDSQKKMFNILAKSLAGLKSNYYVDIKERVIIREHEFDGIRYNIISNFIDSKWVLTKESKIIDNHLCYKATKIKKYKSRKGDFVELEITAWYAPDIPIPLGPKNYVGLPGLIIKLEEGNNNLTFDAIKIDLDPTKKISYKTPKGKIITEDQYVKITEGSINKFIESMK